MTKLNTTQYCLDAHKKEFVIEQYNQAKPFSNFLPGIAGLMGIPLWVFYVNRGQGVVSFGTEDKEHAIVEYLPANKAYQLAALQGFRTFIKIKKNKTFFFYEPFQTNCFNACYKTTQRMFISSAGLKLEEVNATLGLKVHVEYFTIPNASFAGLARKVTLTNLGASAKELEVVDGLPAVVPYGMCQWFIKEMSRTIEAWMLVENLEKKAPFYRLRVDPADKPEVVYIEKGNFYLSFTEKNGTAKLCEPIVDPDVVFNASADFGTPHKFFTQAAFRLPASQMTCCKTPSAFGFTRITLPPKKEGVLYAVSGRADSITALNALTAKITSSGYFAKKAEENNEIIGRIQNHVFLATQPEALNLYTQQTYLDNVLRGGMPIVLDVGSKPMVFYVYSRKHGDLERDYNRFLVSPYYFSQGNGNYRDICQNRRLDTWFNSEVRDSTVIEFFNLIQSDGYNPLIVREDIFEAALTADTLKDLVKEDDIPALAAYLEKPYKLGELLVFIEQHKIKLLVPLKEFMGFILGVSRRSKEAQHGEGFWSDHWAYNLDTLENYCAVYPEKVTEILLEKKEFVYFDNDHIVRPRAERYVLYNNAPRQLHSVHVSHAKHTMIKERTSDQHVMRTANGLVYRTTLAAKMLCIIVNKIATLDPFGAGIEMEADKPNWFDALNGLPGLCGSSSCETIELKRWVKAMEGYLNQTRLDNNVGVDVAVEVLDFMLGVSALIKDYLSSDANDRDLVYWEKSNALKESFREKTRMHFIGAEKKVSLAEIKDFLHLADEKLAVAMDKARDKKSGLICSYFINRIVKYDFVYEKKDTLKVDGEGRAHVRPVAFAQERLPLFLEGPMHDMRLASNAGARKTYEAVRTSPLYDKKLKMYKVTASLAPATLDIGRCRVFTPGWLENESIWLHMEYKYLLELLKSGLHDEFYAEFENCVVAFQNPVRYGRSILENSSFLASSAYPDTALHGTGFVARLSGSTIEFLNMLLIMCVGSRPFYLDEKNTLCLAFAPILDKSLFSTSARQYDYYDKDERKVSLDLPKDTVAFNFLKNTLVVYHNPKRKATFGPGKAVVVSIALTAHTGKKTLLKQAHIPQPLAESVRSGGFSRIDIELG